MFRDILSGSRAIFIGLVFFVLVVGGSLLYSWHVHRTTDAEVAETQRKVQPLENKNETRPAADTTDTGRVDFEHAQTPLETDDAQRSDDTEALPIDVTSEMHDVAGVFLPDDVVLVEEPDEEVPVSPYGFGPYPEVPIDFPFNVDWADPSMDQQLELLDRVLIKAWTEGERFIGGSISDNTQQVHIHYPKTVYVKYTNKVASDGSVTSFRLIEGDLDVKIPPRNEEFPADIRVLDYDSTGIDPYKYLNLQ